MGAASLSQRELKVAELAARGYTNREIASDLGLTEPIVKNVLHSVFDKLGIWNRVELTRHWLQDVPAEVLETSLRRVEDERQAELRRMQVLDSRAEQAFDDIAQVAASSFDVPIALVTLVDSGRVWFKSNVGLKASEVPRALSICHHTIQQSEVLALADVAKDARFVCNSLIQHLGVRFYAAAPILTDDGYALGVVCIVDRIPRQFTPAHLSVLASLARLAMQHLQLRRELLSISSASAQQRPQPSKASPAPNGGAVAKTAVLQTNGP